MFMFQNIQATPKPKSNRMPNTFSCSGKHWAVLEHHLALQTACPDTWDSGVGQESKGFSQIRQIWQKSAGPSENRESP